MIQNTVIIVISKQDEAGMNMLPVLLDHFPFQESDIKIPKNWPEGEYSLYVANQVSLLLIPDEQIFTDYFETGVDTELMIFASKHSSSAGQKALLVHTTGIWQKEAGHGGRDHELAYVNSDVLLYAYNQIKHYQEERELEYWTGIECTHHGPTALDFPIAYFEAGGTEEEWNDLQATKLIADVIAETIRSYLGGSIPQKPAFIGLGGNHYCSRFIKVLDENTHGLGHILPKYATKELPEEMLVEAYNKTVNSDIIFLIDKKGLRAHDRDRFIEFIENKDWKWEFAKDLD